MKTIMENQREIPVLKEADVIIAGGGVSGVAAAIAASRSGAKAILIERNGKLGGIATSSNMNGICNYYLDGKGRPIIRGIAREIVDSCVKKGGMSPLWESRNTPSLTFDPEKFELILIEKLEEAGVQVLLHTLTADVIKDGDRITGVVIESKWGRQAILCKVIIDCSGEADMAWRAGALLKYPDSKWESCNNSSVLFRMVNVDVGRFIDYIIKEEKYPEDMDYPLTSEDFRSNWEEKGIFFFPHGGGSKLKIVQEAINKGEYHENIDMAYGIDALGMYGLKGNTVAINSNFFPITKEKMNIENISKMEIESKKMCWYTAEFLIKYMPGFEKSFLVSTGSDLGIRTSRWIDSGFPLTEKDREEGTKFYDVVGITLASCTKKGYVEILDEYMDIPLRCMLPKKIENLIIGSGKSIDTKPAGLIRGMSRCMIIGQGAGTAAAVAAREMCSIREVNIKKVQNALLEQGVYLGPDERLKELGLL